MEIKEISRKEYDDFLEKVESYSFLQTSKMSEVLISNNRSTKLLGLVDKEEVLAVGLAFFRNIFGGGRIDFMVGANALDEKYEYIFYDKLKDYVKKLGCLKLVIKLDYTYCKYDQDGNLISEKNDYFLNKMKEVGYMKNDGSISTYDGLPDYQFVKDLNEFSLDDDSLLKSLNNNAQRKIKKAKELGIKVRSIGKDELEEFKTLTFDAAKRQGFNDKSLEYYKTFYDEFDKDCDFLVSEINLDESISNLEELLSSITESSKNKQRRQSLKNEIDSLIKLRKKSKSSSLSLANMILIYSKDQAIYFLGGSSTKYQKLPGAFILQYQAMRKVMEKNIPIYNFFGVDGLFDGSDGVLRFKQNFNGYILRKTGAFIYYPNPGKYKRLEIIKKIKKKLNK